MSLSDRFADVVTKGRYSQVLKENKALSERPGLGIVDMAAQYRTRPVLNQAYILEDKVSIFSEVVFKLKKEIFRPGIEWVPRFAKKCETCGHEMQELKDQCDRCGGILLRDPNYGELKQFERPDGSTFLDRANENGQTLVEVLESFESNLDIADNGVLIVPKRYFTDDKGIIEQSLVHEILSADPRNIEKIVDERGSPGGKGKICLYHRSKLQGDEKTVCPEAGCGRKLYDAHYRTIGVTGSPELYYIEGEVKWRSKYYPSLIYGYPPIFKCIDEARTYEWLERRIMLFYEKGRAPGLVTIPTSNLSSMSKEWDRIQDKMKEDPYYTPWLAFDPEAKSAVSYLNLMGDPSSEMLEVKKEVRERLSSRFGVSLIYQNDVGSSGGLNNEDRQISVQYDTVMSGRSIFDDDVFRWVALQFSIKDFVMRIKRTERRDQESELNKLSLIADVMEKFVNLGMEVEYENGEVKISGKPSKRPEPDPFGSPFGNAPLDAPQAAVAPSVGEQLQGDKEEREQAPQEEVVGKNNPDDWTDMDRAQSCFNIMEMTPYWAAPNGRKRMFIGIDVRVISPEDRERLKRLGLLYLSAAPDYIWTLSPLGEKMAKKWSVYPDNKIPVKPLSIKQDEEVVGKADLFRSEDGWEDWCDGTFSKAWGLGRKEAIIRALSKVIPGGRLLTLAPQELEAFYEAVFDTMTKPEWTLRELTKVAKRFFPGLQDYEYERIARVESGRLAVRAREEQFNETYDKPEAIMVTWEGPEDYRTTEVCDAIKARIPEGGVPLDRLKLIIREVCGEVLHREPLDELVPHFNCRHTFVRAF